MHWLDTLFDEFDAVMDRHGLEKIKTIGDAYMAAHGLNGVGGDCGRVVAAAKELIQVVHRWKTPDGAPVQLRIGLHVGPTLAGIIGKKRFLYDLWGNTVNVASRMESASQPGRILVTSDVKAQLDHTFEFECVPETYIKGKGTMVTWLLCDQPRSSIESA